MNQFTSWLILPLLLLLLAAGGCASETPDPGQPQSVSPSPSPAPATRPVTLYYPDDQAEKLVPVTTRLEDAEDLEMLTLKALIAGKDLPQGASNPFPEGLKVNQMILKDGKVTIDFDEKLYQIQGSAGERMALNSLLKTLGQFPAFKTLSLQVNGQKVDTLGHYDLSEPLPFDKLL